MQRRTTNSCTTETAPESRNESWGVESSQQCSHSTGELWLGDIDGKIEEFRNRALGVLRKEVGSKGVCKWNVLKNLLMIRLCS